LWSYYGMGLSSSSLSLVSAVCKHGGFCVMILLLVYTITADVDIGTLKDLSWFFLIQNFFLLYEENM